ncbi:MAG: CDP-diacylglycerol--glycerol-3-phosphate 3-phosphatidyltransferase [Butyricicoccus sp.]
MTTANKITLVRIAMIPFFVYFGMQPLITVAPAAPTSAIIALVLFCAASFTDFLDGYVARKYNQVTDFGKFVDPLADKLLVTAALLIFVEQSFMASWMVFIILAREFIITSLRIVAANKGRVLAATWTGKVKTCVQIAGIIINFLLAISLSYGMFEGAFVLSIPKITAWVMTLVTLYSGWDYLHKNWDLIKDGAVKEK